MNTVQELRLPGPDGKSIRADRLAGRERQLLSITGFLSMRWGTKGWGFCCYDVRGFGDSEGSFADYTLSDWVDDARTVVHAGLDGPPLTIVGNSLGGWIAWLRAQEFNQVGELILIAPAFDMMGRRAQDIAPERRAR